MFPDFKSQIPTERHISILGKKNYTIKVAAYPDSFVDEILVVQFVFLRDVMFRKFGQFDQLRHDLLLLVRVGQVHKEGHDTVGDIL